LPSKSINLTSIILNKVKDLSLIIIDLAAWCQPKLFLKDHAAQSLLACVTCLAIEVELMLLAHISDELRQNKKAN